MKSNLSLRPMLRAGVFLFISAIIVILFSAIFFVYHNTKEKKVTFNSHHNGLKDILVSPTGRHIATIGNYDIIRIWNLDTLEMEKELNLGVDRIHSMAWHKDEELIAISSHDNFIRIVDLSSERVVYTIDRVNRYDQLKWDERHNSIISIGGSDEYIQVFNIDEEENQTFTFGKPLRVRNQSVSEGNLLVQSNGIYEVINYAEGIPIMEVEPTKNLLNFAVFEGTSIAIVYDNEIALYKNGEKAEKNYFYDDYSVNDAVWYGDGEKLALLTGQTYLSSQNIIVLDTVSVIQVFSESVQKEEAIYTLEWNFDGKFLAAYGRRGILDSQKSVFWVWDIENGDVMLKKEYNTSVIVGISWLHNRNTLVVALSNSLIEFWDFEEE